MKHRSHSFCWSCAAYGHNFDAWKKQRLFAFKERECNCCAYVESQALTEGEEEI